MTGKYSSAIRIQYIYLTTVVLMLNTITLIRIGLIYSTTVVYALATLLPFEYSECTIIQHNCYNYNNCIFVLNNSTYTTNSTTILRIFLGTN